MQEKNERLMMAIELAVKAHGMQLDKGGMLYVLHPLHVMDSVDGIDAKIVAVLHDVIEDTDVEIAVLYENEENDGKRYLLYEKLSEYYDFGDEIIDAIDAITKREGEKKEAYWARVKANPLATRVKLADIAHNCSPQRLAVLSTDEANYLRSKYTKALAFLTQ